MSETAEVALHTRANSQLTPRIKRPKLTDPRLIAGTVLVLGSVGLGTWVVDAARANEPVFVAATTLTAGTSLTPADLVVGQARLGEHAGAYLDPAWDFEQSYVLTQTVAEGEFIPRSALVLTDTKDHRVIAIPLSLTPPGQIKVGARVDLWLTAAADAHSDTAPVPQLVAANLTVSEVPAKDGVFAIGSAGQVHVVVDQEDVRAVLAAVQSPGVLVLLPAPGAAQ